MRLVYKFNISLVLQVPLCVDSLGINYHDLQNHTFNYDYILNIIFVCLSLTFSYFIILFFCYHDVMILLAHRPHP